MDVEVCLNCRKLFNYLGYGSKLCPSCRVLDDSNFQKVKEFIQEHGKANKYEIATATGVSPKRIDEYLRDGRLEIPNDSPIFIKCERCGCDIRSGRYCSECAGQMKDNLSGVCMGIVGDKPVRKGSMHFLDKRK